MNILIKKSLFNLLYSGGKPQEIRKSSIIRQRTRLRVGREPSLLQVNVRYGGRIRLQDIGGYQQEVCYYLSILKKYFVNK